MDSRVLIDCKEKLLKAKSELLNRYHTHLRDFRERSPTSEGDEADQAMSILAENQMFIAQQRIRFQLLEIEAALARIEKGLFGVCEETEEPIEIERLLAIPWTRLSIEGAEIRESMAQRQA